MFYLKEQEINQLNKIKAAVEAGTPVGKLIGICNKTKAFVSDKNFVYTYAACLLASQDKVDDAMQLFALNKQDTFCSIMLDYLKDTGSFEPTATVFKSAAPYNTYVKTEFYQRHQLGTIRNIRHFAEKTPPPTPEQMVTIVDIGPGNGVLITKIVNEIAPIYNIKSVRLIIVDFSEDMLKMTTEYCKRNLNITSEIISICTRIQDISTAQIRLVQQNEPIWFINAALSVHHMPREIKIPMLKQMRELSPYFVLTEVNWNHDNPEKQSPELIYSVAKNYAIFSESILHLAVSEAERKDCLYNFPIAEAINIIKQDRTHRIDYHTPIEEWKKIGREAGYSIIDTRSAYSIANKPFAFVMVFHRNRQKPD